MSVDRSHLTDSPGPNKRPRAGSSVSNVSVSSYGSKDNLIVLRRGGRPVRSHGHQSASFRMSKGFWVEFQGSQFTPSPPPESNKQGRTSPKNKLQDFLRGVFTVKL